MDIENQNFLGKLRPISAKYRKKLIKSIHIKVAELTRGIKSIRQNYLVATKTDKNS